MKALFMAALLLFGLTALALPNETVLRNFAMSFPSAEKVQWYDGEDEFNVYFEFEGIKCRAWYDLNGNVKKSIRYYEGKDLPPMVKGSLQKKYPELKIHGVTEYATVDEFVYQVTLEDDKKWYVVHSDASGQCTLVNKLNKSE